VLLDALDLPRVTVFGYSAGGPSAVQFALRHRDRTAALALLAPPMPGKGGRPPNLVGQAIFGSDLFFWTLKTFVPSAFARVLGMPQRFRPTAAERAPLGQRGQDLFPIRPRKQGALFDVYVSTPSAQSFPLEDLRVPTLLINARDDGLSAFDNAAKAAPRIPGATFVPFTSGVHLLLCREADGRHEIARFIAIITA
jgi:pimeloyl-ACP methyl ester carboxylesterase